MTQPPPDADAQSGPSGRFTLQRLSSAFARLMGAPSLRAASAGAPQVAVDPDDFLPELPDDAIAISPSTIVEGMLFVGAPDDRPMTSTEMAERMRDVHPEEVDECVAELNAIYREQGAPYEIVADGAGYRLKLLPEYAHLARKVHGRDRAARLSPAALEVLSIVAYRQPVTSEAVTRLRKARSSAQLAQLVRLQLVRVDRPADLPNALPVYATTDRFNRMFGVSSPADLPSSEDLDDK